MANSYQLKIARSHSGLPSWLSDINHNSTPHPQGQLTSYYHFLGTIHGHPTTLRRVSSMNLHIQSVLPFAIGFCCFWHRTTSNRCMDLLHNHIVSRTHIPLITLGDTTIWPLLPSTLLHKHRHNQNVTLVIIDFSTTLTLQQFTRWHFTQLLVGQNPPLVKTLRR